MMDLSVYYYLRSSSASRWTSSYEVITGYGVVHAGVGFKKPWIEMEEARRKKVRKFLHGAWRYVEWQDRMQDDGVAVHDSQ
jgi:hypothetical protein